MPPARLPVPRGSTGPTTKTTCTRSAPRHEAGKAGGCHASYLERQSYGSDAWPDPHCKHHLSTVHGVLDEDGTLAGYCQVVQCGEIVRVNTILGHADQLADRVMWLLTLEMFKWHIDECDARFGLYYTHDSGDGPGLRYWKERFGMRADEGQLGVRVTVHAVRRAPVARRGV